MSEGERETQDSIEFVAERLPKHQAMLLKRMALSGFAVTTDNLDGLGPWGNEAGIKLANGLRGWSLATWSRVEGGRAYTVSLTDMGRAVAAYLKQRDGR